MLFARFLAENGFLIEPESGLDVHLDFCDERARELNTDKWEVAAGFAQRMLTDGFYAEVTLGYDAVIAEENGGRPFAIEALRPIQLSKSEALEVLAKGRRAFTTEQWRDFLIRSIGLEPGESVLCNCRQSKAGSPGSATPWLSMKRCSDFSWPNRGPRKMSPAVLLLPKSKIEENLREVQHQPRSEEEDLRDWELFYFERVAWADNVGRMAERFIAPVWRSSRCWRAAPWKQDNLFWPGRSRQ